MNNDPIETVVLLHNPLELSSALERFPQCRETLYCTLSPYASYQCEKEGIKYVPLEDYGFNSDPKKMRNDIHDKLLKIIAIADQTTKKYYTREPYISPYRASFRRLIILLAGTRIRVDYLSSLISTTQLKRLVWFGKPSRVLDNYEGNRAFSINGSIEIALLKFQQWEGVELVDCSAECENIQKISSLDSSKQIFKQDILTFLKNFDLMHSLNFQIKMFKKSNLDFIKSYLRLPKEHIILENYSSSWLETCKLLLQRGYKIHPIKDYTSRLKNWERKNISLENELHKALLTSRLFHWEKTNWIDFLFPLIRHLSSLTNPLRKVAQEVESKIRKQKIKCVLTIGAHRAHKYALIQGAKIAGAKVITFQHGGFGLSGGPFMGYDDVDISDYHICPGPGDVKLHKKFNSTHGIRCKPLGFTNAKSIVKNISTEEINQKITSPKKKQTLLYLTSHYCLSGGTLLEFDSPWIDNLIYKNQKAIVSGLKKLIKNLPQLEIILKLHPINAQFNIPEMGKGYANKRFSIVHQNPDIQCLLRKADIILVDTPSTTLIQSVTTQKPIFVLNSHLKLYPEPKNLLEQRAVVKDDPNELIQALEDYFLNSFYPANINNTDFIRSFSDPFGDGRLFERMADLVVETCSQSNLNK